MRLPRCILMSGLLLILSAGVLSAADSGGTELEILEMTGLPAITDTRPGTLKVSSAPLDCTIFFRGKTLTKSNAVMTVDRIPPGTYAVRFQSPQGIVEKKVRIFPGETTIVFGNMTAPAAAQAAARNAPVQAAPQPAATLAPAAQETDSVLPSAHPGNTESNEYANTAFELAEILRTSVNPFKKTERYERAMQLYRRILQRWPQSDKAEPSRYYLGRILESGNLKEYQRAIEQYKLHLQTYPHVQRDIRWRIASLYEQKLRNIPQALIWYDRCGLECLDVDLARAAREQAAQIRARMQ